jgi:hypothetical protein
VLYALFQSEKFIVKQKAKIEYRELTCEEFDFKRATKNIRLTPTISISKKLKNSSSAMNTDNLAQKLNHFMPIVKTIEKEAEVVWGDKRQEIYLFM